MAGLGRRTFLREVNPYLVCPLCRGYLIDATTVVECLHSFCRSCILKHLSSEAHCPTCNHVLNKAKPNIKADKALQDIVYKLVPGLYHKEMRRRRDFYKKHPEHAESATPEQRGEDVSGRLIFAPEDAVSLSLEFLPPGADPLTILLGTNDAESAHQHLHNSHGNNGSVNRRYLQCPALVTIAHLKKFLALKYSVDMTRYTIEVCLRRAPLPEHWTLMDVAYIYAWKRNAPMRFFYRIAQEEPRLEAPPHERPSTPGLGASLPPADTNANTYQEINEKPGKGSQNAPNTRNKAEKGSQDVSNTPSTSEKGSRGVFKTPSTSEKGSRGIVSSPITAEAGSKAIISNTPKTPEAGSKAIIPNSPKTPEAGSKAIITNTPKISEIRPQSILNNRTTSKTGPQKVHVTPEAPETKPKNVPGDPKTAVIGPRSISITIKPGVSSTKLHFKNNPIVPEPAVASKKLKSTIESQQCDKSNAVVEENTRQIKSPLKILKNPDGRYEVLRSPTTRESGATSSSIDESKASSPEFSVVSIGDGQNSNGVKITLKQRPSGSGSKKPQVISNVLVRCGNKINKDQTGTPLKSGKDQEPDKLVSFPDDTTSSKIDSEAQSAHKKLTELPDKNQFLQSFQLTARESSAKSDGKNDSGNTCDSSPKVDVYAFPSEPPQQIPLPPGAVKRKCPPGLPIFEAKRKKHHSQSQTARKTAIPSFVGGKSSQKELPAAAKNPTNPPHSPPAPAATSSPAKSTSAKSSPRIASNTRNLLDGCGLNIPASLSITLTAPKSPGASSAVDAANPKDNPGLLNKVNPSITLNDRSVDPRVLKALKSGQIRMPAPPKPKAKTADRDSKMTGKRKRDQVTGEDALDLSGGSKMDMHPLRIPQPVPKPKAKGPLPGTRENSSGHGQVITLMGGQRYYRAPPGSLTPAAHRVTDCPLPAPPRTPVYAPSCMASPPGNSRPSLSSVFPSLQSLYALSQAHTQNLQQLQIDGRLRLPRIDGNNPGKSHLAAQCAPVKPSRSSVASLAVPIVKQPGPSASSRRSPSNSQPPPSPISTKAPGSSYSPKEGNQPIPDPPASNLVIPTSTDSSSRGAPSPRVTSTASPSPPPSNDIPGTSNATTGKPLVPSPEKNIPTAEVTSSKSPASPDSSSAVPESSADKSIRVNVEGAFPVKRGKEVENIETEQKKEAMKSDLKGTNDNAPGKEDNKGEILKSQLELVKITESKQMTSEMFHKRFLAAFPSNEWANNPVAAEHLDNFLKSLSSMQAQSQKESEVVAGERTLLSSKVKDEEVAVKPTSESTE